MWVQVFVPSRVSLGKNNATRGSETYLALLLSPFRTNLMILRQDSSFNTCNLPHVPYERDGNSEEETEGKNRESWEEKGSEPVGMRRGIGERKGCAANQSECDERTGESRLALCHHRFAPIAINDKLKRFLQGVQPLGVLQPLRRDMSSFKCEFPWEGQLAEWDDTTWSTRISTRATTRQFTTALVSHISRSRVKPAVVLWGAASIAGVAYALYQTNKVHLEAPQIVQQPDDEEIEIDPGTSIAFPKTLRIPSKFPLPKFSLVGVGTRTVSLFGFKEGSFCILVGVRSDPLRPTPAEKINHIVRNTSCVIRIVPTRNTSYTHLRDGFVRALTARVQLEKSRGALTPETEFAIQSPLHKLKTLFPNAALTKGTPLDVLITAPTGDKKQPRKLVFRDLGSIESDWVAEQFVLAYFEGDGITPPPRLAFLPSVARSCITSHSHACLAWID
ncbi:hypothetical protein EDC04DRAFT_3098856 [Pisolithus marmoratus]|nr:hypothetical protein EDC04DRAFT_3098856 [Pisolithus marmoratus]